MHGPRPFDDRKLPRSLTLEAKSGLQCVVNVVPTDIFDSINCPLSHMGDLNASGAFEPTSGYLQPLGFADSGLR